MFSMYTFMQSFKYLNLIAMQAAKSDSLSPTPEPKSSVCEAKSFVFCF